MLLPQGHDQRVEIAAHYFVEFIKRQVNAVISDATLRKIIGANAF